MPADFAMPVAVPSTSGDDAGPPEAGLAARVAAGPGLWEDEDWLADLRRESLPESLLAGGTIAAAAAAEHAHKQERALNAEATALCLVTGALFPVLGYDSIARPGLRDARPARSGPAPRSPTGPAYSKARARSGEAPARAMFEADAARGGIPAARTAPRSAWRSPRSTAPPWNCSTTRCSRRNSGSPLRARKPLLRLVGLLHSGTRRWKAAVIGRYLTGRTPWPTGCRTRSARGS